MAWCYEIRGSENRLVELRTGFNSEKEAQDAGRRAKRMIDCICYPNLEKLTLVTKEDGSALDRLADFAGGGSDWLDRQRRASSDVKLKYPWQKLVLDAFSESHPENLPRKIATAERCLSRRLLDPTPFETDERIAIGEALLALRRLLRELRERMETVAEPADQEETA